MKIRYVKSLAFIVCITIMPSSRGTGNTLAEILRRYPILNDMSLEYTDAAGKKEIKKGDEIVEFLSRLDTLPQEWVKSEYDKKTPLQHVAEKVGSGYVSQSKFKNFLPAMVEKLCQAGAVLSPEIFKQCASAPQTCLTCVKRSDTPFLKTVKDGNNTAIDIIIQCASEWRSYQENPSNTVDEGYKEALENVLTRKDYPLLPQTLSSIISNRDKPLMGELFKLVLEKGTLSPDLDYSQIFKGRKVNDIEEEVRAALKEKTEEEREKILKAFGIKSTREYFIERVRVRDNCLACVKNSSTAFLQKVEGDKSAIDIIIQEAISRGIAENEHNHQLDDVYKKALEEVLTRNGYTLLPQTLAFMAAYVNEGTTPLAADVFKILLEKGTLSKDVDYSKTSYKEDKPPAVDIFAALVEASGKTFFPQETAIEIISLMKEKGIKVNNSEELHQALKSKSEDVREGFLKAFAIEEGTIPVTSTTEVSKEGSGTLATSSGDASTRSISTSSVSTSSSSSSTSSVKEDKAKATDEGKNIPPLRSGVGTSGGAPTLSTAGDISTSNTAHTNKTELLSSEAKNALIGVVVVTSLAGLFYGVRHIMKKDTVNDAQHREDGTGERFLWK